jgi:hypothetical protein
MGPALRSRVQVRLAVELYYATDRKRSEALSAEAVATADAIHDASALASALGARHVALWRPDRVEERLAADVFELGDRSRWSAPRRAL